MRIVAVSMVKNECDIIESFVRYHAPLLEAHYILDNRSGDSTLHILQRLRDEGLPVVLVKDVNGSYDQSRKMTDLMRRAAIETNAEYILPLDADEFVLTVDRSELEARFQSLRNNVGMLQWFDYIVMHGDDKAEPDPLRRICHRIEPAPKRYKVCVPRQIALRPSVQLCWGQHDVEEGGERIEGMLLERPLLAHVPIRSGPQLVSKAIIGRLALRASPDWEPSLGLHWDRIAGFIKDPSVVTEEQIYQATLILSDPEPGATIVRSPLACGLSCTAVFGSHFNRPAATAVGIYIAAPRRRNAVAS
jgi:hypothetical protein